MSGEMKMSSGVISAVPNEEIAKPTHSFAWVPQEHCQRCGGGFVQMGALEWTTVNVTVMWTPKGIADL